jgi:bacteriocin biosynthesis cyclodehydratase domain-containing protein
MHPWIPLLARRDGRVMTATGPHAGHGFTLGDSHAVLVAARAAEGRGSWSALCEDPVVARGLGLLWQQGALIDGDDVVGADLPPQERATLLRAKLTRLQRPGHPTVPVERRRDLGVTLTGPAALVEPVATALAAAGVGPGVTVGSARDEPTPQGPHVDVVIGRPDYGCIRQWMLGGVAHLVISPRSDSVRVGPLVIPGVTSCLQCLHLVRCDRHSDWPSLWEQLRRSPLPEPDPVLMQHAAALVARCLVDYTQTGRAAVTNAFVSVGVDDLTARVRMAPRHPLCGCWWPRPPADEDA